MIRTMKWILLLSTLAGATHAGAQATIAGYTTLDYDAQSNTMIATCTSNRSYSATAYYDLRVNCTLSPDDTTLTYVSSPYGDGSFEFTPVDNVTYQAIGDYGASFTEYVKKALPNPGGGTYLLYEYYDPFDFSEDSDPGFEYPPYEEVWDGEGSQAEYVIPEFVDFGEVPSNPVASGQQLTLWLTDCSDTDSNGNTPYYAGWRNNATGCALGATLDIFPPGGQCVTSGSAVGAINCWQTTVNGCVRTTCADNSRRADQNCYGFIDGTAGQTTVGINCQ